MSQTSVNFTLLLLIFFLVSAVPSAAAGAALARRGGRPAWHGMLAGFCLPWVGLLFTAGSQPSGRRYQTGPAQYAMVMLFVASAMTMISVFLPWGLYIGPMFRDGAEQVAPYEIWPLAVLVWTLALALLVAALGLLFTWGFAGYLPCAIVVAGIGGFLVAGFTLDTPPVMGDGAWVALVALVTAYVAVIVAPFGLRIRPVDPVAPAAPPPLPQQPGAWGPQQQTGAWGTQPPARPTGPVGHGPGATW